MDGSSERFVLFSEKRTMEMALREIAAARTAGSRSAVSSAAGEVRVLLDTPKTVLVPSELFVAEDAEKYLWLNNMSPNNDEEVVITPANEDITAVMAFSREALDTVREVFGNVSDAVAGDFAGNSAVGVASGLHFGTPFERVVGAGSRIYLTGSNLYGAVVREGRMVWCDMLPYSCAADLRYYAAELTAQYPHLEQVRVQVSGLGAHAAVRELRHIFRNVCC